MIGCPLKPVGCSMFRLIKVVALLVILGGGYLGYSCWGDLTPGEKHHLKDHTKKAIKSGEFKEVGQAVSTKIKDKAQTQKSRMEDKSAEVKKQLQKAVHEKAQEIADKTKEAPAQPTP